MKKIFRLSAIVAMISMMATTATFTSCSDDEDEEEAQDTVQVEPGKDAVTFTVDMGGSASTAGSFLSVKDKAAYTTADVKAGKAGNVEIIFDGTEFKSAALSENGTIKTNGNSASIKNTGDKSWSFETSTGFTGTLTLDAAAGDNKQVYVVTVDRVAK